MQTMPNTTRPPKTFPTKTVFALVVLGTVALALVSVHFPPDPVPVATQAPLQTFRYNWAPHCQHLADMALKIAAEFRHTDFGDRAYIESKFRGNDPKKRLDADTLLMLDEVYEYHRYASPSIVAMATQHDCLAVHAND